MPRHRRELRRRALIVGEVRLPASGQWHVGGVVPVLAPDGVEAVAVDARPPEQARVLRLALADEEDRAAARRGARRRAQLGDDMLARGVANRLRRIEAQAVEVELANPIGGVLDHELTHVGPSTGRRS